MTHRFELYWSFRSPYSYLATGRLVELTEEFDVECIARPVYPLAVRDPEFFDRVNPLFPRYLFLDTVRIAEQAGIPYGWPRPDPVVHDIQAGVIPKEQPHIHRLTRLGVAAAEHGRGLAFLDHASRTIWSGEVDGWNEGDHLAKAASAAGLDLAELDAEILADPGSSRVGHPYECAAHRTQGNFSRQPPTLRPGKRNYLDADDPASATC